MSDVQEQVGDEQVVSSERQERDWKSEATEMGWKEDHDGPDRLDPKEFVLRKPLYDEMKKLRKKAKELETAVRTQTQVQEQLLAKERQEILNNLKAQKIQAIEDSDAAKVVQLDEQIEQVRNTPVQRQAGPPPEFIEWSSDPSNSWYSDDEDMQAWADARGIRMYQQNPNRPISEIYAEISRKVKEAFPHKFTNPNREKGPTVESGTGSRSVAKQELSEASIPSDYKQVFHTMWRSGAWGEMTKKDAAKKYAQDLVKIGVINEKD